MSIICAITHADETWIGSDSRSNDGDSYFDGPPKFVRYGEWAVGCAGDHRTLSLIENCTKELLDGLDNPFEFTQRIRQLLEDNGYDRRPNQTGAPDYNQVFILARPGCLWDICQSLSIVAWRRNRLLAIGTGAEVAVGADYIADRYQTALPSRIRRAIESAIANKSDCGGDIHVEKLER